MTELGSRGRDRDDAQAKLTRLKGDSQTRAPVDIALEEKIRDVFSTAPLPTPEQIARLRALLRPTA
jgi:hypothetical protein